MKKKAKNKVCMACKNINAGEDGRCRVLTLTSVESRQVAHSTSRTTSLFFVERRKIRMDMIKDPATQTWEKILPFPPSKKEKTNPFGQCIIYNSITSTCILILADYVQIKACQLGMSVPNLLRNKMSVTVSSQWFVKQQLYKQTKKKNVYSHTGTPNTRAEIRALYKLKKKKKKLTKREREREKSKCPEYYYYAQLCSSEAETLALKRLLLLIASSRGATDTALSTHRHTPSAATITTGQKAKQCTPPMRERERETQDGKRALPPSHLHVKQGQKSPLFGEALCQGPPIMHPKGTTF